MGLWALLLISYSQNITITGGSPNYYLKADEALLNWVRITETLNGQLVNFQPGDKVLIIQMTGTTIDSSYAAFKTTELRTKQLLQSTGKFEILQLDEVNTSGVDTIIYFTHNLANKYNSGEKIQLVRLVEGETVTVTGTVAPRAWDGEVGGILAIIGIDTVKLQNNSIIDASGRGFRGGAVPGEIYEDGRCRYGLSSSIKDTLYFRSTEMGRSGNKGEGIISVFWPYTKGTGFNINGGGAGNGLFAGGGGGSNYRIGGDGGQQSSTCTSLYSVKGGWGGYACGELYNFPKKPKAIMGGGGGSGTRMNASTPSRGGNGGGMVIIITGTLMTGSATVLIKANGENAFPSITAGSGGGGGAAGTIMIDAAEFKGSLFGVQIRGGNGSSSSTTGYGAGGSGSGGIFLHAGTSIPAVNIDSTSGSAGLTTGGIAYAAHNGLTGYYGAKLKNLIIPLTGFLFNTIHGTDTICAMQMPDTITASQPKGGNGIYNYVWQDSIVNGTWKTVTGGTNISLRTYVPPALTETTWYRRVVTSDTITDISREIEIFVYPAIANNSIMGTDTICHNTDGRPLTGIPTPLAGGNGSYSFIWQSRTDQTTWDITGTEASFDPGALISTTHYRRIVNSTAYCHDTTDFLTITVLDSISDNHFSITDTSICENTSPGQLNINSPSGGDGVYTFQWQLRSLPGSWTSIASTEDSLKYSVGILTDTTSYRRIVFSGNDNACIDTSNVRNIIIKPLITNNGIVGPAIRYTCYNSAVSLTGSDPANGFGPGTYSYSWEESSDNAVWNTVTNTNRDYQSAPLTAARYFRRMVYSTPEHHECSDVSNVTEVRINPLPSGNVINNSDTLCAGSTLYVRFTVSGNGPFNVAIQGENLAMQQKNQVYGPVDSIGFMPLATQQFTMVTLADDSSCMANAGNFIPVTSGIVYEVPAANAGADADVCGNTYVLHAVKSNPSFNGMWTATGAVFTDAALENSNVTIDNFGPNIFTWTETNWHCTDADDVEVVFYEQPQTPDAGPDQELDFVYTTQLQALSASVGSGKWTVSSGTGDFSDDTQPDATVSELADKTVLKWTVTNGTCPAVSDSLLILVKPLIIAKAFTPNNDNQNDYFDLKAAHAESISIEIYNSVGLLVYKSHNYLEESKLWDGRNMKGVELPEGTYYYIANIKVAGRQEAIRFKSFIEILRR